MFSVRWQTIQPWSIEQKIWYIWKTKILKELKRAILLLLFIGIVYLQLCNIKEFLNFFLGEGGLPTLPKQQFNMVIGYIKFDICNKKVTVLFLCPKFWLTRGRIHGRNPKKSLKSFPPCFSQSHLQLCLEINISSHLRNLLQFLM